MVHNFFNGIFRHEVCIHNQIITFFNDIAFSSFCDPYETKSRFSQRHGNRSGIYGRILRRIGTVRRIIDIISICHFNVDWELIVTADSRDLRCAQFINFNMIIFGHHRTFNSVLIDVYCFNTIIPIFQQNRCGIQGTVLSGFASVHGIINFPASESSQFQRLNTGIISLLKIEFRFHGHITLVLTHNVYITAALQKIIYGFIIFSGRIYGNQFSVSSLQLFGISLGICHDFPE